VDTAQAMTVPASGRGIASLVRAAEVQNVPVDDWIIEACGDAMHHLGGLKLSRLGVSSSVRGEGRTSIATAMAIVQARDYGRSTLLLDADLDGPHLADLFGLESGPGLADVVRDQASVKDALHPVGGGLTVMTAGEITHPTSRLAAELKTSSLLSELQADFDVVIADLPPLLMSTTGALLSEALGIPLLVVRAAVTPAANVRQAIASLSVDPVVMLNGSGSSVPLWIRRFLS
jgi:Mrp family chromosome partitioning ATPase